MGVALPNNRPTRQSDAGMTLLEVIVVLAIIAGLAVLLVRAGRKVADSELREETVAVSSLLRVAYSLAAQTGLHHRVVFDLDADQNVAQKYRVEVSQDAIRLKRDEEETTPKEELLEQLRNRPPSGTELPELRDAESEADVVSKAAALEGVRVGSASCAQAVGPDLGAGSGSLYTREVESNVVEIDSVQTQHIEEPVTKGTVSVNFFPQGYAEKAVVALRDNDGDPSYVVVHRLTGKIEIAHDEFEPEDHMRRDARGEREKER